MSDSESTTESSTIIAEDGNNSLFNATTENSGILVDDGNASSESYLDLTNNYPSSSPSTSMTSLDDFTDDEVEWSRNSNLEELVVYIYCFGNIT